MRTIIIMTMILTMISCAKKDSINHFLIKPITQQELENNGFYKYSYQATLDDHDKIDDTIKSVAKYDMYSNVKPEKNKEGKLCPTQLWNFYSEDSIKKRKNTYYFKNELKSKVITYVFKNNVLFHKDVEVNFFDKTQNQSPGFKSTDQIIKYYDNLKISLKPIIKNILTGEHYTGQFMIDNYRTRFYFSEKEKYYGIFVNYLNDITFYNNREHWYSGRIDEIYYYD